jgi:hypothetical protein
MRVLCSGSAGFVASALIRRLGSHRVIAVDYLKSFHPASFPPNVRYINFDLSTKPLNISGDIDLIIHLATINQIAIGTGEGGREIIFPVAIDIGGRYSRIQLIKVRNEVDRILNASILLNVSGYNILDPDSKWIDLSNKYTGLWRYVYDINVRKLNASRTTGGG